MYVVIGVTYSPLYDVTHMALQKIFLANGAKNFGYIFRASRYSPPLIKLGSYAHENITLDFMLTNFLNWAVFFCISYRYKEQLPIVM